MQDLDMHSGFDPVFRQAEQPILRCCLDRRWQLVQPRSVVSNVMFSSVNLLA